MHWTGLAMVLVMLMAAPFSLAAELSPEVELTVVADDEGCEADASLCYRVTEENLSDIRPGTDVAVPLQNHGQTYHELMVRTLAGTVVVPPSMANT